MKKVALSNKTERGKLVDTIDKKFNEFVVRQLFDRGSSTYTYLLGDLLTRTAILIDPVFEQAQRDLRLVKELKLNLKFVLNTHIHADHITSSGMLKRYCGNSLQSIISSQSKADADIKVDDGDKIRIGKQSVEICSTPGHTPGCISCVFHSGKMVFTGDALLIRGCGRTDLQGGCSKTLYNSIHTRIFTLPDDYIVYPAHDYNGWTCSTIGEEKNFNYKVNTTLVEFVQIMDDFAKEHSPPRKLTYTVPANRVCGLWNLPSDLELEMSLRALERK